jgi:hypothetical protein
MFSKQPKNAKGTFYVGLGLVVFSLLMSPFVFFNPVGTTRLGLPIWAVVAFLLVAGLYFAAYGFAWMRRDRR